MKNYSISTTIEGTVTTEVFTDSPFEAWDAYKNQLSKVDHVRGLTPDEIEVKMTFVPDGEVFQTSRWFWDEYCDN